MLNKNYKKQAGFSLMELMIGLTVGLIVLAGASTLMVGQINDHRRLALETRTQQDLRAAAEMMSRELQYAGSWILASEGVWSETNTSPIANPYGQIETSANGSTIRYSYSIEDPAIPLVSTHDNSIQDYERRGFRLVDGAIQFLNGRSGWQPITDPNTLAVSSLNFNVISSQNDTPEVCEKPCNGLANCPPKLTVRSVHIDVVGSPARDQNVRRNLSLDVRLQDQAEGVCAL
jgi:prepilin-type N-terminal cleavage/methylation domain-containing protein